MDGLIANNGWFCLFQECVVNIHCECINLQFERFVNVQIVKKCFGLLNTVLQAIYLQTNYSKSRNNKYFSSTIHKNRRVVLSTVPLPINHSTRLVNVRCH